MAFLYINLMPKYRIKKRGVISPNYQSFKFIKKISKFNNFILALLLKFLI